MGSHMWQKALNTKVWGALEFVRIYNVTIPFISGFLGVVLALEGISLDIKALSGMFIPVCLWSGGQIFNDIFDLDVDQINTPYRAVPSGRFTLREAVAFGGILTLTGIALSVVTQSSVCQGLTLLAIVLSNLYSYTLKRKGIIGHCCLGFCVFLCIYIGQSAVAGTVVSLYAPLVVFLYHTSLNIMASVGDVPGDAKTNVITLPVQLGGKQATVAASFFWVAGVLWSLLFADVTVGRWFLVLFVVAISLYSSQLLYRHPSPANATTSLRLFRLGTIVLQISMVFPYLGEVELAVLILAIGTFTVTTFLLFEIPKGIREPLKGVAAHE